MLQNKQRLDVTALYSFLLSSSLSFTIHKQYVYSFLSFHQLKTHSRNLLPNSLQKSWYYPLTLSICLFLSPSALSPLCLPLYTLDIYVGLILLERKTSIPLVYTCVIVKCSAGSVCYRMKAMGNVVCMCTQRLSSVPERMIAKSLISIICTCVTSHMCTRHGFSACVCSCVCAVMVFIPHHTCLNKMI